MAQYKSAVITKKGVALMGKIMSGSTKLNFSKICTTDTKKTFAEVPAVLKDKVKEILIDLEVPELAE